MGTLEANRCETPSGNENPAPPAAWKDSNGNTNSQRVLMRLRLSRFTAYHSATHHDSYCRGYPGFSLTGVKIERRSSRNGFCLLGLPFDKLISGHFSAQSGSRAHAPPSINRTPKSNFIVGLHRGQASFVTAVSANRDRASSMASPPVWSMRCWLACRFHERVAGSDCSRSCAATVQAYSVYFFVVQEGAAEIACRNSQL